MRAGGSTTHNGYDFGTLGSTRITFPIEWHNAKIPGFALLVSVSNYRGLSAQVVMSSVAARFFLPQVAGLPIIPPATGVLTMTKSSNRPRTFSTSRGKPGRASASTGAMTAAW
jgi:hypothetical protein